MSEIKYNFEEIYFINSIKFRLHYFKEDQYKELVRRVDSFMQVRKPRQNSEVYFLADGEEIRITFTSQLCCSVYYKRKQDLE